MSTFADARAQLATNLAGLSITSPETMSIKVAHQFPRASLASEELPCFIIAVPELRDGPAIEFNNNEEIWTFSAGLFVANDSQRPDWVAQVLSAFIQAVLTRFQQSRGLEGQVQSLGEGTPRVLPANAELFGGLQFPHVTFEFDIRVGGEVTTNL